MEWIKCSERLPKVVPILQPDHAAVPDYNWVPVCNKNGDVWSIARYAHKNINGKLIECWEFFDKRENTIIAAEAGDIASTMKIEEIYYWLDIWNNMPENCNCAICDEETRQILDEIYWKQPEN